MIKILFLCGQDYVQHKMSRVRFHYIEAISKETRIKQVIYWGKDYKDYDSSKTVQCNLDSKKLEPDVIVAYKPDEYKDFIETKAKRILVYNEMHPMDRIMLEITHAGPHLVVCHHHNEMLRFQHALRSVRFVNIPHCSDTRYFKDYQLPKKYDVLLIGRLSSEHYPLRTRMHRLLQKEGAKYNLKVHLHQHPGYNLADAEDNRHVTQYAKLISRSRIAVFCSGVPKTRFSKYTEVPLCGTAIAADIPDDCPQEFSKFVISLDMAMTDRQIMEKLLYYIQRPNELAEITKRGQVFAQQWTTKEYAKLFVNNVASIVDIKPIEPAVVMKK